MNSDKSPWFTCIFKCHQILENTVVEYYNYEASPTTQNSKDNPFYETIYVNTLDNWRNMLKF